MDFPPFFFLFANAEWIILDQSVFLVLLWNMMQSSLEANSRSKKDSCSYYEVCLINSQLKEEVVHSRKSRTFIFSNTVPTYIYTLCPALVEQTFPIFVHAGVLDLQKMVHNSKDNIVHWDPSSPWGKGSCLRGANCRCWISSKLHSWMAAIATLNQTSVGVCPGGGALLISFPTLNPFDILTAFSRDQCSTAGPCSSVTLLKRSTSSIHTAAQKKAAITLPACLTVESGWLFPLFNCSLSLAACGGPWSHPLLKTAG